VLTSVYVICYMPDAPMFSASENTSQEPEYHSLS
jgi:hypothetical protein